MYKHRNILQQFVKYYKKHFKMKYFTKILIFNFNINLSLNQ